MVHPAITVDMEPYISLYQYRYGYGSVIDKKMILCLDEFNSLHSPKIEVEVGKSFIVSFFLKTLAPGNEIFI